MDLPTFLISLMYISIIALLIYGIKNGLDDLKEMQ